MSGDLISTQETYDFILSEGDLRAILAKLETLRIQNDKPHCVRFHLEPAINGMMLQKNSIEPLTKEIVDELRRKGQLGY